MNVCYTTITNNYDQLKDPRVVSEGWDYVCFSDRFIDSDVWQVHVVKDHNRLIKIKGYLYVFHELALYVDGSIEIIGDLNQFITEVPNWFTIWKHPHRSCTYKEGNAIVRLKGMNRTKVDNQLQRYKRNGLPGNWGLGANGIMLRDFSDRRVRRICDKWWREYTFGVKRDQLSLMYVFYKLGYKPNLFGNEVMNKYFIWGNHAI